MNIVEVKKRLNKLGFGPLSETGEEAQVFGPKTIQALKKFQASTKGRLVVDGKPGPQTLSALFPEPAKVDKYNIQPWDKEVKQPTLRLRALNILLSQHGVREKISNGGPAVAAFLASVGLGPGYSWCMAFMYWGMDQAAHELGVKNPLVRTGGCLRQWNETTCKKIRVGEGDPLPGDIFIMKVGEEGAGHTGMVMSYKNGIVTAIEGNTNDNGSSNGDGVYIRERKLQRLLGFIRC